MTLNKFGNMSQSTSKNVKKLYKGWQDIEKETEINEEPEHIDAPTGSVSAGKGSAGESKEGKEDEAAKDNEGAERSWRTTKYEGGDGGVPVVSPGIQKGTAQKEEKGTAKKERTRRRRKRRAGRKIERKDADHGLLVDRTSQSRPKVGYSELTKDNC